MKINIHSVLALHSLKHVPLLSELSTLLQNRNLFFILFYLHFLFILFIFYTFYFYINTKNSSLLSFQTARVNFNEDTETNPPTSCSEGKSCVWFEKPNTSESSGLESFHNRKLYWAWISFYCCDWELTKNFCKWCLEIGSRLDKSHRNYPVFKLYAHKIISLNFFLKISLNCPCKV